MDAIEQLQEDLRSGQIDAKRLVELLAAAQRQLQAAEQRIRDLEQRNADLEKKLAAQAGPAKIDEPFSVRSEEKRQQARGKKRRPRKGQGRSGRLRTSDKIA